jgi:uncharacterized protein YciI
MKALLKILLVIQFLVPVTLKAQESEKPKMKTYTFVMLKKGNKLDQDSTELALLQKQHLEHLSKMAETGDLNVAGPFLDRGNWRGILIFNTDDAEKVKRLVEEDPAVKAGRFSYEIHPWMTQQGVTFK